jgi:hypothetical protein
VGNIPFSATSLDIGSWPGIEMKAAEIASLLGGAHRSGAWWRCRCPVHNSRGATLTLRDGERGLIAHCHAGCTPADILAELRCRELIQSRFGVSPSQRPVRRLDHFDDDAGRIEAALRVWDGAKAARGTPVERYLASRGITIPLPPSLRWSFRCKHPGGIDLPAMIARVESSDGHLIGIHRTYLRPDGAGKADVEPQKAMLGRVRGGAVRLAPASESLIIGEGIETTLSGMQATGLPGWAALSASGLLSLFPPSFIREIFILADHDANGLGERAAHRAARRWRPEKRRISIWISPHVGTDANDLLLRVEPPDARRAV